MTAQQVCQHVLLRLRHSEYPVQFLILRTKFATATEESDAKDGIAIPIDPLTSQDQSSVSIRAGEGPTRRGGAAGKKEFLHRSEEHTSELQSLMSKSYDVFCLDTQIIRDSINNQ